MKKIFLSILTILFLTSSAYGSMTWKDVTSGIDTKEFNSIAVSMDNPHIVYVAGCGGIYKTQNRGMSWLQSLYLGGRYYKANFILINPCDTKIVYAATDKGLYKTQNSGRDWKRIFSGIDRKKIVRYIAIDISTSDRIYIGTDAGLFKSENSGNDWIRSKGLLAKSTIYHIAINPAAPHIIFAVSDRGLFKSEDEGATWKGVFTYIVNNGANNEESDVGEMNEVEIALPEARVVAFDPFDSRRVYLGTEDGIFESLDNGLSWRLFNIQGLLSKKINFLLVSNLEPFCIYAATEKGVFQFYRDKGIWLELHPDIGSKKSRFLALSAEGKDSMWIATEDKIFHGTDSELDQKGSFRLETDRLFAYFKDEPSIQEIQRVAVRYAEVHPDKIADWRKRARNKAFLPQLSFGIDRTKSDTYEIYTSSTNQYYMTGPEDQTEGWDINLTWDLGDLVWNDDQTEIDVRSKLMVQLRNDILDEVTRYYFERRRLQLELLQSPPESANTRIQKELRLQELTANIDALTGGYLSEYLENLK